MIHISGRVIDATTREPLKFANVFQTNAAGKFTAGNGGTITNENGTYFFNGTDHVTASYVGYKSQTKPAAHTVHFELEPTSALLPEAEVIATRIKKMKPAYILGAILAVIAVIYAYKKWKS